MKHPLLSAFTTFLFLLPLSSNAQLSVLNEFGDLTTCDTMTRDIYIVWWDKTRDLADDADVLLDTMIAHRQTCLDNLAMADPPNPQDGYYYNVYLHGNEDVFPDWWANGQGTDQNGYPYLTLPLGAHLDWVNVAHETFHVFQYNATAPGFSYSGDSQWYIEASANWYAGQRYPDYDRAFIEGESLVRLPQVALWLSYDNFPDAYPQNWQRYVHQYAMAILLYYMTEEAGVPDSIITDGMYTDTEELPQEYYFNRLGADTFRQLFVDWAAHMINDFDFLKPNQVAANANEWEDYAEPEDDFEYILELNNSGTNGWYRPMSDAQPRAWAFNTYKIANLDSATYTFSINGDATGSNGGSALFMGAVVVKNSSETAFHNFDMLSDLEGQLSLDVSPDDYEIALIVASVPAVFRGVEQRFPYEVNIEKGEISTSIGIPSSYVPVVVGRYDLTGRPANADQEGFQVVLYSNGHSDIIYMLPQN